MVIFGDIRIAGRDFGKNEDSCEFSVLETGYDHAFLLAHLDLWKICP